MGVGGVVKASLAGLALLSVLLLGCRAASPPASSMLPVSREHAQVLVAIGASDAVGIGATNPDSDNWVARLGGKLPSGSRVVNLGISGATAQQALEQELPVAADAAPTLAAVWLGVNDIEQNVSLDAFSANLSGVLSGLRQTGSKLYVGNLPDLRLLPAFNGRDPAALDTQVRGWNAAIGRIVREQGATLVDVYTAWGDLKDVKDRAGLVSADGLHPTSAGYGRLADLFWQAIESAK
ncbi:MAG TPA: GDSL-type esterase/lipase family protein [Dehalococcoidia bacterium]|nr:GDSL-type esterase/lipase family protein [Dehalococcoidia bacterium]